MSQHPSAAGLTPDGNRYLLNGESFRLVSGAIHYFRVLPEYHEHRLQTAKAMGVNTIETYVAWNLHEPRPGQFDFDSRLCDLEGFIRRCADLDLHVIVRPGPYICAEWEFGGLPAWLLNDASTQLRCMYEPYLVAVNRFYDALMARLVPLQASHGGPIIAMQIENEYGSYGSDKEYLAWLRDSMIGRGVDVMLFTSDGPQDDMLTFGTLPGIHKTVNFGSRATEAFAALDRWQPDQPRACMEFWNGWFDHWGDAHHTRSTKDATDALDEILSRDGNVNFYMLHGGTNFGWMNGANHHTEGFQPTVTSYDYDAAITEWGDVTPKFTAFREVIHQHTGAMPPEPPPPMPRGNLGSFELVPAGTLRSLKNTGAFGPGNRSANPRPMEALGQSYGLIHYQTRIPDPLPEKPLIIRGLHDRAHVFANGTLIATLERARHQDRVDLAVPEHGVELEILVENQGRVNYGPELIDRKGITRDVLHGQQAIHGWEITPIELNDPTPLLQDGDTESPRGEPRFWRGSVEVDTPVDTFVDLSGFQKGVVWVNGFNLGRYWEIGPQRRLYLPAPLLESGSNEFVILELDGTTADQPVVHFVSEPDLG